MIISIPIKPYLKDFLINMYGQEPIPASNKNLVGILLEPMLQKPPKDYIPAQTVSKPDNILIQVLNCKKKEDLQKNPMYYFWVSADDQNRFQRGIANIFNHVFYTYADSSLKYNKNEIEIKICIDNFCQIHKLNPEYASYDMLKKNYYRYRIHK